MKMKRSNFIQNKKMLWKNANEFGKGKGRVSLSGKSKTGELHNEGGGGRVTGEGDISVTL